MDHAHQDADGEQHPEALGPQIGREENGAERCQDDHGSPPLAQAVRRGAYHGRGEDAHEGDRGEQHADLRRPHAAGAEPEREEGQVDADQAEGGGVEEGEAGRCHRTTVTMLRTGFASTASVSPLKVLPGARRQ
jgi:hypothetical protein